MYNLKWSTAVILGLVGAIHIAAAAPRPSEDIPVHVIYDNPHDLLVFNPQANPQVKDSLKQLADEPYGGNPVSLRNHDEKTQLSPQQLREAPEHFPAENVAEEAAGLLRKQAVITEGHPEQNNAEKVQLSGDELTLTSATLGRLSSEEGGIKQVSSFAKTNPNQASANKKERYARAEEAVLAGFREIETQLTDANDKKEWRKLYVEVPKIFRFFDVNGRGVSERNQYRKITNEIRRLAGHFVENQALKEKSLEHFDVLSNPSNNALDVVNNGLNKITNTLRNLDPLPADSGHNSYHQHHREHERRRGTHKHHHHRTHTRNNLRMRNKNGANAAVKEERYQKAQAQVIAGFKQIEDKLLDAQDPEAVAEWQKVYEDVPRIFNFFGRNDQISEKEKLRKVSVEVKRLGAQFLARITNENNPALITKTTAADAAGGFKQVVEEGVEKITKYLQSFDPSVKKASSLLTREERYKKGQDAVLNGFKDIEAKLDKYKQKEWKKLYQDVPRIFKFFDVKDGQVDEKEQFRKISVEVKRLSQQFLAKHSEYRPNVKALPVVTDIVRKSVDEITYELNNKYGLRSSVPLTEDERYRNAQDEVLQGFQTIERKLQDARQGVDIEEWQKLYVEIPKIFQFFDVKGVPQEEKLRKITVEVNRLGNHFLENVFIDGKSVLEPEPKPDASQIVTIGIVQISEALKNYNLNVKHDIPKEERYKRAQNAVVSSFKEIEKQLKETEPEVDLIEWRKLYTDIPKIFDYFNVKSEDVSEGEKFAKVSRELERMGNQFVEKLHKDNHSLKSAAPIGKIVDDGVAKISDTLKNYDVNFREVTSEKQRYQKAQESVLKSFKEIENTFSEPNDVKEWQKLYDEVPKIFDSFNVKSGPISEKEKFRKISVELKRLSDQFLERVNVERVEAKPQSNVKYIVRNGLKDIEESLKKVKNEQDTKELPDKKSKLYKKAEKDVLKSFKDVERKLLDSKQPVDVTAWQNLYPDVPKIFDFFDVKSPDVTEEEQYRKISKEVRRLSEQFIEKANAAKLKSLESPIHEIVSEGVTELTNTLLDFKAKSTSPKDKRYLTAEATIALGFRSIGKKLAEAGKADDAKLWERTYTEIPKIFQFFDPKGSQVPEEEKYRKIAVELQRLTGQFLEAIEAKEQSLKNGPVVDEIVSKELEKIANDLKNFKPETKQTLSKDEQYQKALEKVVADFRQVEGKLSDPEHVKEWKNLYPDIPKIFKFFDVKAPGVSEQEKYRKIGNEVQRLGGQFINRLQANRIKDKPVVSAVRKQVKEKIAQVITVGINKISDNLENFHPTASIATDEEGEVVPVKSLKKTSPIVHVNTPMSEEERYKKAQHTVLSGFKQIEHDIEAATSPEHVQQWKKLYPEIPKIFKFFDVKNPETTEWERLKRVENEVRRLANQYVEKIKAEELSESPLNQIVVSGVDDISNTLINYEKIEQPFPNSKAQRYLRAQAAVLEAFKDIEKELQESQGPLEVSEWRKMYADIPKIFDFFNVQSGDANEKEQFRKITVEIRRLGDQYVERVRAERKKLGKSSDVNELVNGKVDEITDLLNTYETLRLSMRPLSSEERYENAEKLVKGKFEDVEKELEDETQKSEWKKLYADIPKIFQFFNVKSYLVSEEDKYEKVAKEIRRLSGQFLEKVNEGKSNANQKFKPSANEIINAGMTQLSNTLSYLHAEEVKSALSTLSREERYKLAQTEVMDEFKEIEKELEKLGDPSKVKAWRNLYHEVPKIFDFFDLKPELVSEKEQLEHIAVQLKGLTSEFVEKFDSKNALKFGLSQSAKNIVDDGMAELSDTFSYLNGKNLKSALSTLSREERYKLAQTEVVDEFKKIEKQLDENHVQDWRKLYSEVPKVFEFFDVKADKISEEDQLNRIMVQLKGFTRQFVDKVELSNKPGVKSGPRKPEEIVSVGMSELLNTLSYLNGHNTKSALGTLNRAQRYRLAETEVVDEFKKIEKELRKSADPSTVRKWMNLYEEVPKIFKFFDVKPEDITEEEQYGLVTAQLKGLTDNFVQNTESGNSASALKSGQNADEIIKRGVSDLSNTFSYLSGKNLKSALSTLSREERYKLSQTEVLDEFKKIEKQLQEVEGPSRVQEWRNLYSDVPKIFNLLDVKAKDVTEEEQLGRILTQLKGLTGQYMQKVKDGNSRSSSPKEIVSASITELANTFSYLNSQNLKSALSTLNRNERYKLAQTEVLDEFKKVEKQLQKTEDPNKVQRWKNLYQEVPKIFSVFAAKGRDLNEKEQLSSILVQLKGLTAQYVDNIKPKSAPTDVKGIVNVGLDELSGTFSYLNGKNVKSALSTLSRDERYKLAQTEVLDEFKKVEKQLEKNGDQSQVREWKNLYPEVPKIFNVLNVKAKDISEEDQLNRIAVQLKGLTGIFVDKVNEKSSNRRSKSGIRQAKEFVNSGIAEISNKFSYLDSQNLKSALSTLSREERYKLAQTEVLDEFKKVEKQLQKIENPSRVQAWKNLYQDVPKIFGVFAIKGKALNEKEQLNHILVQLKGLTDQYVDKIESENLKLALKTAPSNAKQIVNDGMDELSNTFGYLSGKNLKSALSTLSREERYKLAQTEVLDEFKQIEKQLAKVEDSSRVKEWRNLYSDVPKIFNLLNVKAKDINEEEQLDKILNQFRGLTLQYVEKVKKEQSNPASKSGSSQAKQIVHNSFSELSNTFSYLNGENLKSALSTLSRQERYKLAQTEVQDEFKRVEKELLKAEDPSRVREWKNLYREVPKIFSIFAVKGKDLNEKEQLSSILVQLKGLTDQYIDTVELENNKLKSAPNNVDEIVNVGLEELSNTFSYLNGKNAKTALSTLSRDERYKLAQTEVLDEFKKIEKHLEKTRDRRQVKEWKKLYSEVPKIFNVFDVKAKDISEEEQLSRIMVQLRGLAGKFVDKVNAKKSNLDLKSGPSRVNEVVNSGLDELANTFTYINGKNLKSAISTLSREERYKLAQTEVLDEFKKIEKQLQQTETPSRVQEWRKLSADVPKIFESNKAKSKDVNEEEQLGKIFSEVNGLTDRFLENDEVDNSRLALKSGSSYVNEVLSSGLSELANTFSYINGKNLKSAISTLSREERYKLAQTEVLDEFKKIEKQLQKTENPNRVQQWKSLYGDVPKIFESNKAKSNDVNEEEQLGKILTQVNGLTDQFLENIELENTKFALRSEPSHLKEVVNAGMTELSNTLSYLDGKNLKSALSTLSRDERYKLGQTEVLDEFKKIEKELQKTEEPSRVQEWRNLYSEVPKIFQFFDVKRKDVTEEEQFRKITVELKRLTGQFVEKVETENFTNALKSGLSTKEIVNSGLRELESTFSYLDSQNLKSALSTLSRDERYKLAQTEILDEFKKVEKQLQKSEEPSRVLQWRNLYQEVPKVFAIFAIRGKDLTEKEQLNYILVHLKGLTDLYVEKPVEKFAPSKAKAVVNVGMKQLSDTFSYLNSNNVKSALSTLTREERYTLAQTEVLDEFKNIENQLKISENPITVEEWKGLYLEVPKIFDLFNVKGKDVNEEQQLRRVLVQLKGLTEEFLENVETDSQSEQSFKKIVNAGLTELKTKFDYLEGANLESAISTLSREERYKLAQTEVLDEFKEIEKKLKESEDPSRVQEWRNLYHDVPKIFDFFDIKADDITEEEQFRKITVQLKRLTGQFVQKVEHENEKFALKTSPGAPVSAIVNEGLQKVSSNLKNFKPNVKQVGPFTKEQVRYHMAQSEVVQGFKEIEKRISDPLDVKEWQVLYAEIPRIFRFFDVKSDKVEEEEEKYRKISSELKRLGDQYLERVSQRKNASPSNTNKVKQNIGEGPFIGDIVSAGINTISTALNNINPFQQTWQSGLAQNAGHDPVTEDSVSQSPSKNTTTVSQPAPGGFPNPFLSIQNAASQVVNAVTGQNNNNPPAGVANEEQAQQPGPIQMIFQQVGQAIGINQPAATPAPGTSGDTQTGGGSAGTPFQPFQGINQVFTGLFNQGPTPAPGAANEEQGGPFRPIQQAIGSFGQSISNVINNNQNPTPAPGASGDTQNPAPGAPGGGNIFQSFQNTFQSIFSNQGNQGAQPSPGSQGDTQTNPAPAPTNPVQGFQNFVSGGIAQIGTQFQQLTGGQSTNNPINTVQNAIQNNNNLIPAVPNAPAAPGAPGAPASPEAPNPPTQNEEQPGTQGVSNVANQISTVFTGGLAGAQQQAQNVANQIGAAVSNPSPGGATPSGANVAPPQQVSNLVNQVGAAVSGANPQQPAAGSDVVSTIQGLAGPQGQIKNKPQKMHESKTKIEFGELHSRTADDEDTVEKEMMHAVE